MNSDIVITIGFTILTIMYLIAALSNIKFVLPQAKVMLMVLNSEKTAKDLSDLRLVVGTFLQTIVYYPGHVKNIEVHNVRLPVNGARGKYNVTFNHIQVPCKLFSAKAAFFNSPERKPFTAMRVLILAELSQFLLGEKGGRSFERGGTEAIVSVLQNSINERANSWGIKANDVDLGDVDMPEFEESATALIAQAHAEAEAFKIEKEAQGPLYPFKEVMDTLRSMPGLRFLSMGGEDSMLNKVLGAIQSMDDKGEQK